ncbi:SPT3 Dosage dependent suppressor of Ty-induced promoter mutations-like protein [Coemansia sp. RSA 1358]|uniref:SPT3 Dosage dependent suppressor of Ty-induced promoter mutations-like protein n=1 Tax=Coemansia umbellata TaxID=1424467 RepID=A0ABQ8PEU3_9FUNG|nr:SPT3 Dosage dependent suppressor of Ty-induced promoter mutations-like protein [Coemansia umbellata]KAJ2622420.1 SPT3 Dosage dependent suppressor of Ty-induced promoter mutations-like protein [Coemansia sp. RSA 1358]
MDTAGNTSTGPRSSSSSSDAAQQTFHDYLKASSAAAGDPGHTQGAPTDGHVDATSYYPMLPDLSFLLATGARSTPGSPAQFAMGFSSMRTSPVPGPQSPASGLQAFSALPPQQHLVFDPSIGSAVQSATASPTAFNRRGLLTGMANLNVSHLDPAHDANGVDTTGMFNISSPFAAPLVSGAPPIPSLSISGVPSAPAPLAPAPPMGAHNAAMLAAHPAPAIQRQPQLTPTVSPEFLQRVEETKAKGLRIELEGIPSENARSRVETQIKMTLRLTTADGERATCWSHLALPELLVSREKFRHRASKQSQPHTPGHQAHGDSMPLSPQHVVHLETKIICSSDPTRKVETCYGCIKREYKRSLRRKDARLRSAAASACSTPVPSRPASPTLDPATPGRAMTGNMEADWDEERIEMEKQRIVIYNCNDLLDFSKGEVMLPTRITCYCRHHGEKVGFYICLTMRDHQGNELASLLSPPVMITDDHKSTKGKVDRGKARTKPEYERQGDGNAAYANHVLAGLGSPTHGPSAGPSGSLHLVEGSAASTFLNSHKAGARQAFSARNSPTLRPYSHHALLDTYSQFASLAGTPSLGPTPLESPMLSAAHISGYDSPFNLPQAAALGGNYQHPIGASALFNSISGPQSSVAAAAAAAAAAASTAATAQLSVKSAANSVYGSPVGVHMQHPSLPVSPIYGSMQQQQQQQMGGTLGLQQAAGLMDPSVFGGDIGASAAAASLMPQFASAGAMPMQINQLMPAHGPLAGGTTILISGRGFHPSIAVFFGDMQASRVHVVSSSNITCVLPPFKTPGSVSVRIHDLLTMSVYESTGAAQGAQQSPHQQGVFTYVDDTDQAMLDLSLHVIGLRQSGSLPGTQSEHKGPLSALGSPQMSPVMQARSGSSPGSSRKSSPSTQSSGAGHSQQVNRMVHDQLVLAMLRALRTASESRNLVDIENSLVRLFMTLLNKGLMDPARLSLRHEATGRTLLHFVSLLGMMNLLTFLVSHGVGLDDTENSGLTALHFASMFGRADIFELLLSSGASTLIRSGLGQTPGDLARALGHVEIQALVEERNGYADFIRDGQMADLSVGDPNNTQQFTSDAMQRSLAGMVPQMTSGGGSNEAMFDSNMMFGSPHNQQ